MSSGVAVAAVDRDGDNPRVQRTRAALLAAFNRLFLEVGYDAISPARIAAEAGVGRSTFYEHYAGKAALLRHSVTPLLQTLAAVATEHEAPLLEVTLRHLWDNRRLARRIIVDRSGTIVRDRLSELIMQAWAGTCERSMIPLPLLAASAAAAQLALIDIWLTGRYACSVGLLAEALVVGGRSVIVAPIHCR